MHALLVDDDSLGRVLLAANLRDLGVTVVEADSGPAGLDFWRSDKFDVAICDIVMPEFSGIDFAHAIRKSEKEQCGALPLRLIALTGLEIDPEHDALVLHLFAVVLSKPVLAQTVMDSLTRP